jgi:hypothetical protein
MKRPAIPTATMPQGIAMRIVIRMRVRLMPAA